MVTSWQNLVKFASVLCEVKKYGHLQPTDGFLQLCLPILGTVKSIMVGKFTLFPQMCTPQENQ